MQENLSFPRKRDKKLLSKIRLSLITYSENLLHSSMFHSSRTMVKFISGPSSPLYCLSPGGGCLQCHASPENPLHPLTYPGVSEGKQCLGKVRNLLPTSALECIDSFLYSSLSYAPESNLYFSSRMIFLISDDTTPC